MTDPIADHLADLRRARYSRSALATRERVLRSLPAPVLDVTREQVQD